MFLKFIKYYWLLPALLLSATSVTAQLGGPLLNISFGDAPTGDLLIPGPRLPKGYTDFSYTTDVCPPPGSYSVVSGINNTCYDNEWIPLFSDNTPYPDLNGYMMVINDTAYARPRTIFRDSVRETCNGVNYQFSAAIINLERPSGGCVRFSAITLQVEDYLGNVIASTNTGDIQFAIYAMGYHFTKYVVDFTVPVGTSGVVLKIIDNLKSSAVHCHNALAIDDIQLKVTGPEIAIAYDSTDIGDWVKSTCFQDNRSYTMSGKIDSTISNPGVHWQQSTDDGATWTDIPGAIGYTLTQSFSVVDTFLFRLRGSDSMHLSFPNCGVYSNLLKVQVNGIPSNLGVSNNSPICAGQDLVFSVRGGASYLWSGPNGFTDNSPFAHIFHSTLADSGRYYVQITTEGGCSAIDSTDVVMRGVDVIVGPDTTICKGHSVQLSATGGNSYKWSPPEGLSNPNIPNPKAAPQNTTTYTLNIKDTAGCANAGHVTITLRNTVAVHALFSAPDFLCRSYDSATFRDASTGNIVAWNWSFGNGQTAQLSNPATQYYSISDNDLSYTVALSVADTTGCSDTAYHAIKVANNCYIAVPTAFTPNGDGLNDFLYPLNAYKATNLIFRIYNRNGQLIFESRDWTKKWDGTLNNVKQASGVYVWMLEYNDATNHKIALKGTTTLIR